MSVFELDRHAGVVEVGEGLELRTDSRRDDLKPLLAWACQDERLRKHLVRIAPGQVACNACLNHERRQTTATWWLDGVDHPGGLCDRHVAVLAMRVRNSSVPKGRSAGRRPRA
jgi:hypothetical protein